jgi:hypothetical protein
MTLVILRYFVWHYTKAFEDVIRIELNFFWSVYHFFSIPNLFRSLFSPWERLRERYSSIFKFEEWFGSLIVNVIMRIVGALIRFVTILLGIACLFLAGIIGVLFLILWPFIPVFILGLIAQGIYLMTY